MIEITKAWQPSSWDTGTVVDRWYVEVAGYETPMGVEP